MTAAPAQPERDGLLRRLAGDSGYLLSGFPLAVAGFAVIVTGLSAGVGLLVVVVGLPVLAADRADRAAARRHRATSHTGGTSPAADPADLSDIASGRRHLEARHDTARTDSGLARRRTCPPALPDRGVHLLRRRHVVGGGDRRHFDRRVGLEHSEGPGQPIARPADRARRQRVRQNRLSNRRRAGLPGHSSGGDAPVRAGPGRVQSHSADRGRRDARDDHGADGPKGGGGVRGSGRVAKAGAGHARRSAAAARPPGDGPRPGPAAAR